MTDSEAVRVLELMDAKATAAVVDRLGALAAVYLLRMDATAAVRLSLSPFPPLPALLPLCWLRDPHVAHRSGADSTACDCHCGATTRVINGLSLGAIRRYGAAP
jgi:hypothetical protein